MFNNFSGETELTESSRAFATLVFQAAMPWITNRYGYPIPDYASLDADLRERWETEISAAQSSFALAIERATELISSVIDGIEQMQGSAQNMNQPAPVPVALISAEELAPKMMQVFVQQVPMPDPGFTTLAPNVQGAWLAVANFCILNLQPWRDEYAPKIPENLQ